MSIYETYERHKARIEPVWEGFWLSLLLAELFIVSVLIEALQG